MRSFFPKGEVRTHADHVNTLHAIVPDGFRIVVREVVVDNARNLESAALRELISLLLFRQVEKFE